jgi:hypothetical protein
MSERYNDFIRLVDWLNAHLGSFNAPYGVLDGNLLGKYEGSVICYTVTFGCARTMDAIARVYSTDKVTLDTRGRYEALNGEYDSVDALITRLNGEFIQPF